MTDLLCQFSRTFPNLAASILHRAPHKRGNFREGRITHILMAGLTAFESFGARVDFPADESKTGDDIDREFVAPLVRASETLVADHGGAEIERPRTIFPSSDGA